MQQQVIKHRLSHGSSCQSLCRVDGEDTDVDSALTSEAIAHGGNSSPALALNAVPVCSIVYTQEANLTPTFASVLKGPSHLHTCTCTLALSHTHTLPHSGTHLL